LDHAQRARRRVAEYCVGKVGFATKQAKDLSKIARRRISGNEEKRKICISSALGLYKSHFGNRCRAKFILNRSKFPSVLLRCAKKLRQKFRRSVAFPKVLIDTIAFNHAAGLRSQ